MLENTGFPIFQISRGGGSLRTSGPERGLQCGRAANWQLFSLPLAPSRINRPGRIPVQTAAEEWPPQDYRCVQDDGAKFGRPTEPMPLYRSDPFQKSPASFHLHQASACLQTPTSDASDAISQLHPAHGKGKTHMARLSTFPSLHFIPFD